MMINVFQSSCGYHINSEWNFSLRGREEQREEQREKERERERGENDKQREGEKEIESQGKIIKEQLCVYVCMRGGR